MELLFASLLVLPATEYFIRLPFISHTQKLLKTTSKATHIIGSTRISDHWKEMVLLHYAQELAIHACMMGLILFGALSLIVLPTLFLDWLLPFQPSILDTFSSPLGLICMTISASFYFILRTKGNDDESK